MKKYSRIILLGFRSAGKTTIARIIAKKIGWKYLEMDDEIVKLACQSIDQITKHGTDWTLFRKLEHDILIKTLNKENIVISTGGGLAVNNVLYQNSTKTYGEINANFMTLDDKSLLILLTANEKTLSKRIKTQETGSDHIKRPILDPEIAIKVQSNLAKYGKNSTKKRSKTVIDVIVKNSLIMYRLRKPIYNSLTSNIIDTSKLTIEQSVEKILTLL